MKSEAIISIRPKFVEAIFSGKKTVELRRKIPDIEIGTRLWIYSTMPVGALVGTAQISSISRGTPEEMWNAFETHAGVCKSQFESYYEAASIAYVLGLSEVRNGRPVDIRQLRVIKPRFHPPQVMSFVTQDEAATFHSYLFGAGWK